MKNKEQYIWAALRIGMGWLFLWPFLDKLFGLGFTTAPEDAWIAGGSPTFGYLKFATSGPLAPIFQSLAGNPVVDWLFMLGLLLIGLALISGIGVSIAAYAGALIEPQAKSSW
jgi:thiosulfate dehydrogenase [quinone] large subunit